MFGRSEFAEDRTQTMPITDEMPRHERWRRAVVLVGLSAAAQLLGASLQADEAAPDEPVAAILFTEIGLARVHAERSDLQRRAALDEIAREEASAVARAADGTGQRGLGAMIRRLERSDFTPATWTAGVWLRALPTGARATDAFREETEREEIRQVLAAWKRAQPGWFDGLLEGDWSHLGVAVARTGNATAYAVIAARDRVVEHERTLERFADRAGVQAALRTATQHVRTARGLRVFTPDERLDAAATRYAHTMLEEGFFAHRSPDGGTATERVRAAGFVVRNSVAENLAKGVFTPEEVIERWLASDGHRRNLLRPGRWSLGVGIASRLQGDEVEVIWVQIFAR